MSATSSPEGRQEAAVIDANDRKTFVIPDGYIAVFDDEGRATGEVTALIPAPVAAPAMSVKGLEWVEGGTYPYKGYTFTRWKTETPFGDPTYGIRRQHEGNRYTVDGMGGQWTSLEAAKAAAQSDFEARIRSALIPAKPAVEVVEATLDEFAGYLQEYYGNIRPHEDHLKSGLSRAITLVSSFTLERQAALQAPATPDAQTEMEKP